MASIDFKVLVKRLNPTSRAALEAAAYSCLDRTHYEITIEHFLLSLLDQRKCDMLLVLEEFGIDREELAKYFERRLETMKLGNSGRPQFSPLLGDFFSSAWLISSLDLHDEQIRSGALWAAFISKTSLSEGDQSDALFKHLTKDRVIEALLKVIPHSCEGMPGQSAAVSGAAQAASSLGQNSKQGAIDLYCEDFTAKAKAGKIDPVFGRDLEIRQMIDILARRRKNNPICVGDPGVGKTAVIEGLALRIVENDVPESLKNARILGLDIGALEAGASVKGEFEKRLRGVIDEIKASPLPILLFIDEAHTLIGSGGNAGTNDAANLLKPALARGELRTIAATTWREYKKYFEKDPALARRFELIKLDEPSVEVTVQILRGLRIYYERIHQVVIRDDAIIAAAELSHRYITGRHLPDKAIDLLDTACARIKVNLSSKPGEIEFLERSIQILDREQRGLEQDIDNRVMVDPARLESIAQSKKVVEKDLVLIRQQYDAELSAAHRVIELRKKLAQERELHSTSDRHVLNQETAQLTAQLIEAESALEALIADEKLIHIEVGPDTIAKIVSDRTGVPLGKMMRDQASEALSFEDDLKKKIKGQDEAMARIAQILKGVRSGLNEPNQPLGIFLLIGPSGVGKTETAISVADMMFGGEDSMISINMSEFQEKHSLSRLVGSPPGYVGFGEGGILTEAVRRRPYSVVLLDEVEKASLDVLNLFYQVFDKGVLSDGEGREIDFKNTVIFLTSNLGLEEITRLCASGQALSQDIITEKIRPTLSAHFKPALLARMTIVPFSTLSPPVLESIVRMKIQKLQDRLINKNKLKLEVTEDAIQAIVARCTEVETGARNIDFILKSVILPLLSDALLTASSQANTQTSMILNLNSSGEFSVGLN